MKSIASCLALTILMNALVETAARMDAAKSAQEFEQGLAAMRAESAFEESDVRQRS